MLTYEEVLKIVSTDKEIDNQYTIDNLTVEEVFGLEYKWTDKVRNYKDLNLSEEEKKNLKKTLDKVKQS